MDEVNFTILGMTGSGKTCYLTGMYYEMCSGIEGYTLNAEDDDTDIELRNKWENLCDNTQGVNRFPLGTDKNEKYKFDLEYSYKKIKSFNWLDYPGGDLESKSTGNIDSYKEIEKSIMESTCLFICVDGALLQGVDKENMINNVRNKCSSKINGFISKYKKKNEKLPPVSIIITKYDICKDVRPEILEEVLKKSFSPLFEQDNDESKIVSIIPISIGRNISDDDYSGRLEPINIHMPIFFGVWFALKHDINKMNISKKQIEEKRSISEKKYREEDSKFFLFRSTDKVESYRRELNKSKNELDNINDKIKKHTEYIERLHSQLKDCDIYIGGNHRTLADVKTF